jgi:WXG100 family type VII secretion target
MSEIKVDFGHLSTAADSLGTTARQIEQHLQELENTLKPLVSTWQGAAQEAYHSAQTEWDQAARNLQEICAKMGMAVNTANDAYQQGEKSNAARFGG